LLLKLVEENATIKDAAEFVGISYDSALRYVRANNLGFDIRNMSEYTHFLARKRGVRNITDYNIKLARKQGFDSYYSYQAYLIKRKGYETQYEYLERLAKKQGYKSLSEKRRKEGEKRRERAKNKSFSSFFRKRLREISKSQYHVSSETGLSREIISKYAKGMNLPTEKTWNFEYCPYCGNELDNVSNNFKEEDWGMLGKEDIPDNSFPGFNNPNIKLPFGFNMIFNSLVKELDKQFKQFEKETMESQKQKRKMPKKSFKSSSINIDISTIDNGTPKIRIRSFGMPIKNSQKIAENTQKREEKIRKIKTKELPENKLKKLAKLPKKEPETNIRRLSNRLIYEIDLPGVKSENDISIKDLENSIEIKALAKNKAYSKIIPLAFPLRKYYFEKGKLVLELDARQ